jgi:hypothetical protein
MSFRATDLSENEARQQAADLNVRSISTGSVMQTTGGKSAPRSPLKQRLGQQPANSTIGFAIISSGWGRVRGPERHRGVAGPCGLNRCTLGTRMTSVEVISVTPRSVGRNGAR